MKTAEFLYYHLEDHAPVTIADTNGNILYEGTVAWVPFGMIQGTEVEQIALGTRKDIIITIKED